MIDRLHASLTRTVIPLIHCVAADIYLLCTLSNIARKRRQSTAGCTHAPVAQLRHPATWLHCATRACMWRTWMTSDRRCRFPPTVCLEKAAIPFTSAVFQPATQPYRRDVSQSYSPTSGNPSSARVSRAGERVLAIADFLWSRYRSRDRCSEKVRFGATPKPARETLALPLTSRCRRRRTTHGR